MKKLFYSAILGLLSLLPAFSTNVIGNGDFESSTTLSTSYWATASTLPGVQTVSIDNTSQISGTNSIRADVTTSATASYPTRLAVNQFITLPKAATYTVTFKAKASTSCSLQINLAPAFSSSTTTILSSAFTLNTTVQTFSYDITTTTASTGLCRLKLPCGMP